MRGTSGRGPTIAMSPRSTFSSWGSSSIFDHRNHAPNRKMRGSRWAVMALSYWPWSTCMVRSLYIVNRRPRNPTRGARYRIGPGLASRMPPAATASSGAATSRRRPANSRSSGRLTIPQRPPDGHEHLGGLQAGLVPPGARPMAQRLERAGVGVRTDFARVTRHGGDLLLERLGDIDPGVGREGPRVPPLGAAGRIERVDGLDAVFDRPGGDEQGAEHDLVIAVRVAPELTVHDRGPHLAHDLLERGDDVGERQRVELLVRKSEDASLFHAEDLSGPAGVVGLSHAVRAVAQRLSFAHHDGGDAVAGAGVQRDGAAAAQELIVGVRGHHEDPLRHRPTFSRSNPGRRDGDP